MFLSIIASILGGLLGGFLEVLSKVKLGQGVYRLIIAIILGITSYGICVYFKLTPIILCHIISLFVGMFSEIIWKYIRKNIGKWLKKVGSKFLE
jgi:hypothetical protein